MCIMCIIHFTKHRLASYFHIFPSLLFHHLQSFQEGGSELQDRVVEQVFKAYFEDNKSLGEQSVLEECASKAGLDKSSDFLSNSDSGAREVRGEMQEFGRAFRCTGVPMFIVDGKHKLSGAQESDAFLRLFGKL